MDSDGIPTSFANSMQRDEAAEWKKALDFEIKSLTTMKTWKFVKLSVGRKVIKNKWVFDLKKNGKDVVQRSKARLFDKGFSQVAGVDYNEVFAPVSRYTSVRFWISLATRYGWKRI